MFYRIERKFVVSEVANEISDINIRICLQTFPPVLNKVSLLNQLLCSGCHHFFEVRVEDRHGTSLLVVVAVLVGVVLVVAGQVEPGSVGHVGSHTLEVFVVSPVAKGVHSGFQQLGIQFPYPLGHTLAMLVNHLFCQLSITSGKCAAKFSSESGYTELSPALKKSRLLGSTSHHLGRKVCSSGVPRRRRDYLPPSSLCFRKKPQRASSSQGMIPFCRISPPYWSCSSVSQLVDCIYLAGSELKQEKNSFAFLSPGLGTRVWCREVSPLRAATLAAGPEMLQPETTTHLFHEA